jgi:hypothetical protein
MRRRIAEVVAESVVVVVAVVAEEKTVAVEKIAVVVAGTGQIDFVVEC